MGEEGAWNFTRTTDLREVVLFSTIFSTLLSPIVALSEFVCLMSTYICFDFGIYFLQERTGSTVLAAEDFMDDGTLIRLKVTINQNEVHVTDSSIVML